MKRFTALILIIATLLTGCRFLVPHDDDPITFYYLQSDFSYGLDADVIVSEVRESAGHRRELSYLMALYLMGPVEEEHLSPLPAGTRIFKTEVADSSVKLHLSDAALSLSPERYTLACACLALTCFDLTDAQTVTIICTDQSITMSRSSLTLRDDSAANQTTEETQ